MLNRQSHSTGGGDVWQPEILDPGLDADRARYHELIDRGAIWRIHDTIEQQLEDLVRTRNPQWIKRPVGETEVQAGIHALLADCPLEQYGRWIHFPWSGLMVHLLPRDEFQELRLNRNRNKISLDEQARLARATIGVVGLSVGNAVATALAVEGLGGTLKLADFDRLDLSNLNRIRASVADIGLPKTVLCARQIVAMNPYAQIQLYPEGLTEENLDDFFGDDPVLELVIDECDDIRLKFMLREKARVRGVPVLMETSDRGMLDVERFDLEPDRPLFHGLLGDIGAADVPAELTSEEKVPFVAPIVGVETLSDRIAASMLEIGVTLSTWPQLGSEVQLGGATVAAAARRLLLGGALASGRRYVDLDALIGANDEQDNQPSRPVDSKPEDSKPPLSCPTAMSVDGSDQSVSGVMRFLVSQAILAPSGGNCQPWRFLTDNETLWVIHDRARSRSLLDPDHRGAYVALGAAVENIAIAAAHWATRVHVDYFPYGASAAEEETETVAALRFSPEAGAAERERAALWPLVGQRMTDRKTYGRKPLQSSQRASLQELALDQNCRLTLLETDEELAEIGAVIGEGDRLRILHDETHREMMAEMRWSPEESEAMRDGLDLTTLELTASEAVGFQLLRRPAVAGFLRGENGGSGLCELSEKAITHSSAVGIIGIEQGGPTAALQGGRAVERLWLAANRSGLALHPMTSLLYMFNPQFNPQERARFNALEARFNQLLPDHREGVQLLLFRLSQGRSGGKRSLRRPIEDVLTYGCPAVKAVAFS